MRKDVKIGLGIGGILLAVLVVYLLVPKTNEGNEYARNGDSSSTSDEHRGGADANPGTGGANSSTTTNPGGAQRGGTVPPAPDGGHDATAPTPPQGNLADAGTDPDARATTLKKIDWETILSQGIVPDDAKTPLAASNRGPSDDPFATDGKGFGAGEPNWAGTGGVRPPAAPPKPATPGRPGAGNTASASKSGLSEHVVKQGENLSTIALAAYGDAKLYKEILKANPGLDERKLKPGVTIKLPDAATFAAAKAQPAAVKQEKAVDSKTEYRVEPGDSLHKIAMKLYGKASKADTLYETNKDRIGDDSARLKVGTVLKLPEAPTASLPSSPMPR